MTAESSGDNGAEFRCPVCGDEFDVLAEADRHFDYHKGSEYVLTWRIDDGE